MPRELRRSLATIVSILVVVGCAGLGAVASTGSAWAVPRFRPIVCTGASQPNAPSPVLVTGCNRRGLTGGSGQIQGNGNNGDDVLTWRTGRLFTVQTDSVTRVPSSPCPTGTAEVDYRGTVVGGSGRGTKPFLGKVLAFDACLSVGLTVVVVQLVPGTSLTVD